MDGCECGFVLPSRKLCICKGTAFEEIWEAVWTNNELIVVYISLSVETMRESCIYAPEFMRSGRVWNMGSNKNGELGVG